VDSIWVVLLWITPIIAAVCRDLVSLCRHVVRRASIERIVRDRTGVIRIVDRAMEGDVLEIEVLPSSEGAAGLDPRSAES
jgi:hypothetical protein